MGDFSIQRNLNLLVGLLMLIVVCGCREKLHDNIHGTRRVTIFFDPSHSPVIEHYPVKATLNGIKILDTLVKNTHINSSLRLACFPIDTDKENTLLFTVFNKTVKSNLNNYKTLCVSAFYYYDDRAKIDSMFERYTAYSIKTTGKIPTYKEYADKLKAQHPGDKYDLLSMQIQNRCLCDSD